MTSAHPSDPNPTIAEALCEIHFRQPPGKVWPPTAFGDFFKRIQREYPEMQPVVDLGVQFEAGSLGVGQTLLPPRPRMRYKHATRPLLLQLVENVFTLNVLAPYPGWGVMRREVLRVWQQLKRVLEPSVITRIGLRYINRIDRQAKDEPAGAWLVAGDYIAPAVLRSAPGFLSRVETRPAMDNRLIITLGDAAPEGESLYGAIIFDIDRIAEQELPPEREDVARQIDRLHRHVREVFDSSKSTKLDQLLKRPHS
jgi:uncharacterized protein (TIGR04255 family)